MRATITSNGRVTIPIGIRKRLGLTEGVVLEFDETSLFLKAVPAFDEDLMRSFLGCEPGLPSTEEYLNDCRGEETSLFFPTTEGDLLASGPVEQTGSGALPAADK